MHKNQYLDDAKQSSKIFRYTDDSDGTCTQNYEGKH